MSVDVMSGAGGRSALDLLGGVGLGRPEELGIVKWAERNHRLSAMFSSTPGPWRLEVIPYAAGPLEAFEDRVIRKITLVFASQTTKSTSMEIMLGYAADRKPMPGMWCFPNEETRNYWHDNRFVPLIDASPRWRGMLAPGRRSATHAGLQFSSMPLAYARAESAADMAARSVGYVFADEIDKYPAAIAAEGSPLDQLRARQRTFRWGKFVQSSTPTDWEGPIWQEWLESDRREWWVRCEGCGAEGAWDWEQVVWDRYEGYDEEDGARYRKLADGVRSGELGVWYECGECGHRHEGNGAKMRMNAAGRWVAQGKSTDHAGFHLPSLASPFTTWKALAVSWLLALDKRQRGDDRKVQAFVIHELARPFRPKRVRLEAEQVREREVDVERGVVPSWVRALTLGVDVQGGENGIYWVLKGWGVPGPRVHFVDWGHVGGRFESEVVWGYLDELLKRRWTVMNSEFRIQNSERGKGGIPGSGVRSQESKAENHGQDARATLGEMLIGRAGLDSGDGMNTLSVYRFCRRWKGKAVRPVKGENALPSNAFVLESKQVGEHGGKLLRVNTVALKDFAANLWGKEAGTGVSFAAGASDDEDFVAQLVSEERRVTRTSSGAMRVAWVPKSSGGANHYLDASTYGDAMAAELGLWGSRAGPSRGRKRLRVAKAGGGDAFGRK